ncbi:filamentous haemagglutinin family protein [Candidatus Methylopumilus turicensis]|uniref:Filamentous hemagglutinin-like protein n=1 Tax=Candidatus Methylopumilus turicensis TaxID=1581680 RepID=A0A0B7IVM2_9PROT
MIGDVAFAGVSATKLNAQLDIRGRGLKAATEASLLTNGALTLTGRQIYPVTNGKFRFETIGIDSSIEIKSSGIRATEIPLSASGLLTLKADNIIQGGSLRAPLGQIVLDANKKLIFDAGSLTSVSAEGQMIPYGLTRLGGLDITEPTQQAVANENDVALKKITAKQVSISAPAVEMNVGATIDISGGGDTLAYEWIQGIGGSSDILAKAGTFAVLPNIKKGEYAPFDYNYTQPSIGINAGDSIHIAGVKGLADGDYALLPARYALLPGAYMVQTSTKAITQATSALQVDGSTLVSTYKSNGGYTDTNYNAFKITDASIFNTPKGSVSKAISEYRLTYGNQFFSKLAQDSGLAIPRISSDAGQLVIAASNNLVLDASVLTNKAETSRGGVVDITSNSIKVVGTKGADVSGILQLTAASLNNLNAESLLLGGTRTAKDDGSTQITAGASNLEFANNNENKLLVKELIAASTDTLTVAAGASISTASASESTGSSKLETTGTGALLAVSSSNDLELERTGNTATGDLSIAADSNISASRSMVLDSRDTANLAGTVTVSNAGSISLGAGRILLGDSGNDIGLKISNDLLSSFGQLAKVTLNSYENIDIYGAVDLGNKALDLTLNAGAIAGHMALNQTAKLSANNFVLKNSLGAVAESLNSILAGQLEINANNIQLVGGVANTSTAVTGFDAVQLNAAKEITVAGLGTTNINATTTSLKSSRISAASAADFTIAATGAMTTVLPTTQAALVDASGLGAKLTMTASTLTLGGKVDLPSGRLIAKASAGDLTVSATGQLKATSVPVKFDKYTEYTPAGKITLQTDLGNVVVESGGLVDVSGKQALGEVGGDAGSINIISKHSATVNGSLKGLASAGNKAGDFVLDANALTLPNFTSLNTALNTGGFTNLRDLRVRTGDITIAAGDTVTAKHVILSADAGKIDVLGTVDASGSNGGKIEMYASDNLTLKTGSKLLAKGTGEALVAGDSFVGAGGKVLLSSLSQASTSAISAESVALIDVSGDQQGATLGEKGSVIMRAYRGTSGTANTVNVDTTATATVKGAENVRLEGVRVYTSTSFNTTTPNIVTDTNAFYTANPGAGIYTTQDGANVTILPNIEVRSSATSALVDLTVGATATDLNMRAFGVLQVGKGGTLTLRSNNNLNINGTLSDGFNGVATNSVLQTGNTFNFNLVAGADLSSANQLSTMKSADATKGNFNLANTKLIRTGTGEINIAAGGNLTMGNDSSVIYTVGKAADTFAGFSNPSTTTAASYLTKGGDININVQGDITGKIASGSSQQLISQWLFRQGGGTGNKNVSWWLRPDLFKQGVAALGGGDVTVNAGGNITNFSASVPTTARFSGTGDLSFNGGGGLFVKAGGSIASGIYFAGKGNIDLFADGKITSATSNFGTTLALQDASAKVSAVKGVAIETIFNPTMWAQSSVNASNGLSVDGSNSFFMTYGPSSTVDVSSIYGDVTLGLTATANITSKTSTGLPNFSKAPTALEVLPGDVQAVSFAGNIGLGRLVLSPAPNGNLNLLASGSVSTIGTSLIGMSDADVNILPSVLNPISDASKIPAAVNYLRDGHAASAVHLSDSASLVVVAKNGSISMPGASGSFGLSSAKALDIFAGKDVSINASIQHNASQDLSVIQAGRDVVMPTTQGSKIQVAGPGEIFIEAGRNVSLGASQGISAVANTLNPALPIQGASLTVLAGAGALGSSVADYIESYINPNGSGPSTLQNNPTLLAAYKSDTKKAVASYIRNMTGDASLSEDAAMTQYLAIDLDRQAIFAYRHFSSELLASGKGYAESQNHDRGDKAIASLFPSDRNYKGDLSLYNSQIRTSRDGSVDILTPGGFINAGVPTSSGNNIGIVTERGGAIRAFAETGFQVEQSKIITQYGSDITVWVNNGDIDAGRGSKTALSVPQRVVSTNADGKTTIEAKGAAAGSGIRAQTYDPDGPTGVQIAPPLGSVALIAPRGILNASEAGIAAGNFLAVATQVLGANNISVSGTSSGVPVASTGSVAGAMTGVSNAAADATKSIASDISRQATTNSTVKTPMPSLISVEVIGLGD